MTFEDAMFQVTLRGLRLWSLGQVRLDQYSKEYHWEASIGTPFDSYGCYGYTAPDAIMRAVEKYEKLR